MGLGIRPGHEHFSHDGRAFKFVLCRGYCSRKRHVAQCGWDSAVMSQKQKTKRTAVLTHCTSRRESSNHLWRSSDAKHSAERTVTIWWLGWRKGRPLARPVWWRIMRMGGRPSTIHDQSTVVSDTRDVGGWISYHYGRLWWVSFCIFYLLSNPNCYQNGEDMSTMQTTKTTLQSNIFLPKANLLPSTSFSTPCLWISSPWSGFFPLATSLSKQSTKPRSLITKITLNTQSVISLIVSEYIQHPLEPQSCPWLLKTTGRRQLYFVEGHF